MYDLVLSGHSLRPHPWGKPLKRTRIVLSLSANIYPCLTMNRKHFAPVAKWHPPPNFMGNLADRRGEMG